MGCGSFAARSSPGGRRMPQTLWRLAVFLPARALEVAAHDRLTSRGLSATQRSSAAAHLLALLRGDHALGVDAVKWFGTMCASLRTRSWRLGEHAPFSGIGVGMTTS